MTRYVQIVTGTYVGSGTVPQKIPLKHRKVLHAEVFSAAVVNPLDGTLPARIGYVNDENPSCAIDQLDEIVLSNLNEADGLAYLVVDGLFNMLDRLYGFTALVKADKRDRYAKKFTFTYTGTGIALTQKVHITHRLVRHVKVFSKCQSIQPFVPGIVGDMNDELPSFSMVLIAVELQLFNEDNHSTYILATGNFNKVGRVYAVSVSYDEYPRKRFHVDLYRTSLKW